MLLQLWLQLLRPENWSPLDWLHLRVVTTNALPLCHCHCQCPIVIMAALWAHRSHRQPTTETQSDTGTEQRASRLILAMHPGALSPTPHPPPCLPGKLAESLLTRGAHYHYQLGATLSSIRCWHSVINPLLVSGGCIFAICICHWASNSRRMRRRWTIWAFITR